MERTKAGVVTTFHSARFMLGHDRWIAFETGGPVAAQRGIGNSALAACFDLAAKIEPGPRKVQVTFTESETLVEIRIERGGQ